MQKKTLFLFLFSALLVNTLMAQSPAENKDPYAPFLGEYKVKFFPSQRFIVSSVDQHLILEIVDQGRAELEKVSENKFRLKGAKPTAFVEFNKDNTDSVTSLTWIQTNPVQSWTRETDPMTDGSAPPDSRIVYTGKFGLKGNPYLKISLELKDNKLLCTPSNREAFEIKQAATNHYVFESDAYSTDYEFIPGENGKFNKIKVSQKGPILCVRNSVKPIENPGAKHSFYKRPGFTHADTLIGMLSPLRTCYDVLFYHLDVTVEPDTKSLHGSNMIRFRTMQDFDRLQVDLYNNMKVEKILYNEKELSYTREADAVFIQFPTKLKPGSIEEITIYYNGIPQLLDLFKGTSGFLWEKDQNGKLWIESVSQGSGASTWWPCKDHLTDKPDSMAISVTVPATLKDISNGKFLGMTSLPDKLVRYDWYVSYPINAYDVVAYIGDYVHFTGKHFNGQDSLLLNFYCLSYNEKIARAFYTRVNPMLTVYENAFGPYPFKDDGFAMVESPYGMEHQSAVSMGALFDPAKDKRYDSANIINALWHESAHEWWGNNVTCKDYADFWIHESFATYAEILAREKIWGIDAAKKYINEMKGENKESIIGYYDVNDFHTGDMYGKGSRMLITLKNVINNDSLWFSLLHGLQNKFRYQSISTEDIIQFVNSTTHSDYTYLFDQYLRHAALPVLMLQLKKEGDGLNLQYKWQADVPSFNMPVKITLKKGDYGFIYPSAKWKSIRLSGLKEKDFKADTTGFYFQPEIKQD